MIVNGISEKMAFTGEKKGEKRGASDLYFPLYLHGYLPLSLPLRAYHFTWLRCVQPALLYPWNRRYPVLLLVIFSFFTVKPLDPITCMFLFIPSPFITQHTILYLIRLSSWSFSSNPWIPNFPASTLALCTLLSFSQSSWSPGIIIQCRDAFI